jgi:hypothetical protein
MGWGSGIWGTFEWGDPVSGTTGLLFGSGVISSTPTYSSGTLTPVYLTHIPSMLLRETAAGSGSYNTGFFSITVQSPIEDAWNFYLEAKNSPSGYILYMAEGLTTNPYGFYNELLELHAGLTDIYMDETPGYVWAQNVSGTYTTGRIPVYFRLVS